MTRGDVYRVRFDRGRGHAQHGPRYGVIVQSTALLALSTCLVAPTSTRASPASFRPMIEIAGQATYVMVDHLQAVDIQRFGEHAYHLTLDEQHAVDRALRAVLNL